MPGGIRFEHLPDIAILTHPELLRRCYLGESSFRNTSHDKTRHPI